MIFPGLLHQMSMRFTFFFLFLSCAFSSADAASHYEFSNPPGPYSVGLQVVQQYDYARSSLPAIDIDTGEVRKGELARPMQTLVWYPAANAGQHLTYGDYLRTAATQSNFTLSEAQVAQATQTMLAQNGSGLSPVQRQAEATRPMWAGAMQPRWLANFRW